MGYPYYGNHRVPNIHRDPVLNVFPGNASRRDLLYDGMGVGALTASNPNDPNPAAISRQPARKRPHPTVDARREERKQERQEREKRFGLSDPAALDAMRRSLAQQQHLSSKKPEKLASRAPRHRQRPRIPSRTSSKRRSLNRFSRQLEKYAEAADVKGKAPVVTPTASESPASLHTVQPLLPYREEFQSAGLAVTSSDQQRKPLSGKTQSLQPRDKNPKIMPVKTDGNANDKHGIAVSSDTSSRRSYIRLPSPDELPVIDSAAPQKASSKGKPKRSDGNKLP